MLLRQQRRQLGARVPLLRCYCREDKWPTTRVWFFRFLASESTTAVGAYLLQRRLGPPHRIASEVMLCIRRGDYFDVGAWTSLRSVTPTTPQCSSRRSREPCAHTPTHTCMSLSTSLTHTLCLSQSHSVDQATRAHTQARKLVTSQTPSLCPRVFHPQALARARTRAHTRKITCVYSHRRWCSTMMTYIVLGADSSPVFAFFVPTSQSARRPTGSSVLTRGHSCLHFLPGEQLTGCVRPVRKTECTASQAMQIFCETCLGHSITERTLGVPSFYPRCALNTRLRVTTTLLESTHAGECVSR